MKKEYKPMALGFWGVGLPLGAFGIVFCKTAAQRVSVLVLAAIFLLVGTLIYRARQ
jgi:formate-dependent nitrite reductase membrane component NrfD